MEENNPENTHSKLGIASFSISVGVGVLLIALFVAAGILNSHRSPQSTTYPGQVLIGFGVIGLGLADLIAAGLGIASLFQPGKKLFGILGIVFSSVIIVGTIGLIILGLTFARRFVS